MCPAGRCGSHRPIVRRRSWVPLPRSEKQRTDRLGFPPAGTGRERSESLPAANLQRGHRRLPACPRTGIRSPIPPEQPDAAARARPGHGPPLRRPGGSCRPQPKGPAARNPACRHRFEGRPARRSGQRRPARTAIDHSISLLLAKPRGSIEKRSHCRAPPWRQRRAPASHRNDGQTEVQPEGSRAALAVTEFRAPAGDRSRSSGECFQSSACRGDGCHVQLGPAECYSV